MTNRKGTKRALLSSMVALLICFSMLVGTTLAWFTDSVTSEGNIIQSGTLEIGMYWANGTEAPDSAKWNDASKGEIFTYNNWEPGYVDVRHIKIVNEGTLALKYQLTIADNGNSSILTDVIDVYFIDGATQITDRTQLSENNKVGTLTEVINGMPANASGTLISGDYDIVTIALKMQEDAGNEYQGKTFGEFAVKLIATQLTAETDSFDDQYDEGAFLGNYITVGANDDLQQVLANAPADEDLYLVLDADQEWVTDGHNGVNNVTAASSVVIDGQGKYTLTATGSGVTAIGDDNAPMTFKDLTVKDASVSYNETAWEFGYLELAGVSCKNVVFTDPIMVEGKGGSFTGCTFTGYNVPMTMYGVWAISGTSTYKNCTFTGTRGLKVCDSNTSNSYASADVNVVVDGCTFKSLSEKPGVAIDYSGDTTVGFAVAIKNSTFINCQPGDQNLYIYETDNYVPTEENNTVMSAVEKEVTDAATMKEVLSGAGAAGAGNTLITFAGGTIDMSGENWTPIKVDGYHGADIITIEGNGTVITGLTAPLFAGGFAGGSGIVIKNLTIADSNIVSTNTIGSGAFIESVDSMNVITLEDCHLRNSTVTGGDGSRTGGLIGWTAGYNNENDGPVKTYVTIRDCSVIGCTITCNGSVGGIYGHAGNNAWTYSTIEDCIVTGNTLTSTDDGGWRVGVVVGTANVGEVTISNITESGNTLTQTGKTAPDGQSNLYGRFVPGSTGKLVIDGVAITA